MTAVIFKNSEGCIVVKPKLSHLLAPQNSDPINGKNTSKRAKRFKTSNIGADFFKYRMGILKAIAPRIIAGSKA